MNDSIILKSVTELSEMIRSRKIGAGELLEIYLERIEQINPELNAIITLDQENARRQAKVFDETLENYGEIFGAQTALPISEEQRAGIYENTKTLAEQLPYYRKRFLPRSLQTYMSALDERDKIIAGFENLMSGYDAWILPVTSTPPFAHIAPVAYQGPNAFYNTAIPADGGEIPYLLAMPCYTMLFNAVGNPAVSLPLSKTTDGLPIGVQVVGKRWGDSRLLSIITALSELLTPPDFPN